LILTLKEDPMQYKTIILQLLEDNPEMYDQLRGSRQLLPTMERLSKELKAAHQNSIAHLSRARPNSDPIQITSEALEIALEELEERLRPASPQNASELSLDSAMAFLRVHAPLA
jgi:hypothetical protein